MSSAGIRGPLLYNEDCETTTATSQRYLTILQTIFIPELRRRNIEMYNVWFQQDGAIPQTERILLDCLATKFREHFITLMATTFT